MKLILGFLKPTQGTVTVGKKRVGKDVDFPQDVGAIIENVDFFLLAAPFLFTHHVTKALRCNGFVVGHLEQVFQSNF